MSINTAVTKKYDNGYVQVEVSSKRYDPVYYKLPEKYADSFQKEYKKDNKKNGWMNAGIMIGAIASFVALSGLITKKIASQSTRTLVGVLFGLTGGVGSMYLSSNIEAKNHEKLMKKYNAELIDYSQSSFPV
mgnify:CR=1 FL=1